MRGVMFKRALLLACASMCSGVATAQQACEVDQSRVTPTSLGRAELSPAFTLTSPIVGHKYLRNPICLFNTRGADCVGPNEGFYLSLPYGQDVRQLPITLRLDLGEDVEEVLGIRVRVRGGDFERTSGDLASNLRLQEFTTVDGRRYFEARDFFIPALCLNPFQGRVSLILDLSVVRNGAEQSMSADVFMNSETSPAVFTPTFSSNRSNPVNPRYSLDRDQNVGYDFWSTYETIDWLRANNHLWINDVSALHSATYAENQSILRHSSHHDGRTIDIRYAAGQSEDGVLIFDNSCLAGYPCRERPGMAILEMLEAAAEPVIEEGKRADAAKTPEALAARARAASWIAANRTLLASAANDAEVIFVGDGEIYEALVRGEYQGRRIILPGEAGAPNRYVGPWRDHPRSVRAYKGHSDHWHIQLRPPSNPS
jgi:hypothetical protein